MTTSDPTPDLQQQEQPQSPQSSSQPKPRKRRPLWARVARIVLFAIVALLLLVVAVVGVGVFYLSPDRLTPMVERYGSEYLDADVKADRVELFFWSTFPQVKVEADSLRLISRSLSGLSAEQRRQLPTDADSLLSLGSLRASVNVPALLTGRIMLHDIELNRLHASLVALDDSTANYLIVPPSEEEKADEELSLPDITLDRFQLSGPSTIRYYSAATATDITATVTTDLSRDGDEPRYHLTLSGDGDGAVGRDFILTRLPFGLDGRIDWCADTPGHVALSDMNISLDRFKALVDADLSFDRSLLVDKFTLRADDINTGRLLELLPDSVRRSIGDIASDLRIDLGVKLTAPYDMERDSLPSLAVNIATRGPVRYEQLDLKRLESDIDLALDGRRLDNSKLTVNSLTLEGRAISLQLKGTVASPLSDPLVDGRMLGAINLDRLPHRLWQMIGFEAKGRFTADASFNFRLSDMTGSRFHRMKLDGTARLADFHGRTTGHTRLDIAVPNTDLKFGASSTARTINGIVDSLLTASVKIDSATVSLDDNMLFTGADISVGAGMKNVASTGDTTQVNPVGARLTARLLKMTSDIDSMTISMHRVGAVAALKRYNDDKRKPQMVIGFGSRLLRFTDPTTRVGLAGATFGLDFHPRAKPKLTRRMAARIDSLRARHPHLSDDSLKQMARRIGRGQHRSALVEDSRGHSSLDLELDPSIAGWLRHLDAKISLKAKGGRMMTAYFPIATSIRNLNLHFDTDTVSIDTLRIKAGQSVMNISGGVGNLRRAVLRSNALINARFDVQADTININELAEAAFRGSAFINTRDSLHRVSLGLDDNLSDSVASRIISQQADSTAPIALVVPSNIRADINVDANNVLYSDIWFQRLEGRIGVYDGAVNLDRIAAYSPIGSIDLTALYEAPDLEHLKFAAGLVVRRLQLRRMLDLMPQFDSIMPLLREVEGVVTAQMAMTTELDSLLDLRFHTLEAMLRLSGDSLVLMDNKTFRTIGKWLMFKNKGHNMIDHMDVELQIKNNQLDLFPFVFDFDRYKLGISGTNDMKLNLNYHIAVLKSPIPFKFGITIKGTPEHLKFRLGGAHFNEKKAFAHKMLTDTARINLVDEIQKVFHFGVRSGKANARLQYLTAPEREEFDVADTLTRADSVFFIREGVIDAPPGFEMPDSTAVGIGHVTGGGAEQLQQAEAAKKAAKEREKKEKKLRREREKAARRKE